MPRLDPLGKLSEMRQLIISTDEIYKGQLLELAQKFHAKHIFQVASGREQGAADTTFLCLNNGEVEPFLEAVEERFEADITLHPRPIITIHAPFGRAPHDVLDTQERSPFEVFQEGMQSIGSLKGLLGYAVLGAVVVWVGLYTNSVSLLVAAMLIAPFAGPAMNLALAVARGDSTMISRSLGRYMGAVSVSVLTTFVLSLLLGQEQATAEMIAAGKVSAVAVFLPLVAGAAGALNLVQSQRDSLVSGAAVGVLVAAALAPPAGNLGMALAIGKYSLAKSSLFILGLQVIAINLSGSLIFALHGIGPRQALYERGKVGVRRAAFTFSLFLLAGFLTLQFHDTPSLQRATEEQLLAAQLESRLGEYETARLVNLNIDYLPTVEHFEHTVLAELKMVSTGTDADREVKERVEEIVVETIRQERPNSTPLVDVTLLEGS